MKNEPFLPYFNDELHNIRNLAREFAEQHPKVAGNLNLTADSNQDPHVDRLIESFAYLTARTKLKLEDGFENISTDLLSALQPGLLETIPPVSIVQFEPEAALTEKHTIHQGTKIETNPVEGTVCQFQTCYPTDILPARIVQASFHNHTLAAPALPKHVGHASACLKVTVETLSKDIKFSELAPEKLRLFIAGQHQLSFALHELIHNHSQAIAFKSPVLHNASSFLSADDIGLVGFNHDEMLCIKQNPHPHPYDLVKEYFVAPEKFLFADIITNHDNTFKDIDNRLEIYFYFDKISLELEGNITSDNIKLGCTPLINAFYHQAEPTLTNKSQVEFRLVLNSQKENNYEILSIDSVKAVEGDSDKLIPVPAAYQSTFTNQQKGKALSWHHTLRMRECGTHELGYGLDPYINLIHHQPSADNDDIILNVKTICCNRNLPTHLPVGSNIQYLQFSDSSAPVEKIQCVTPFSKPIRPANDNNRYWKLISSLNTNHLSLYENNKSCEALKNILSQLNFKQSSQNRSIIESVLNIEVERTVALYKMHGHRNTSNGLEITLELDENRFVGNSAFLFAAIMERFFAQYCSINSFTKLVAVNKGKQNIIKKWPPRVGDKTLL